MGTMLKSKNKTFCYKVALLRDTALHTLQHKLCKTKYHFSVKKEAVTFPLSKEIIRTSPILA